jgi:hypothetical protein
MQIMGRPAGCRFESNTEAKRQIKGKKSKKGFSFITEVNLIRRRVGFFTLFHTFSPFFAFFLLFFLSDEKKFRAD